jgi:hypothetical protein
MGIFILTDGYFEMIVQIHLFIIVIVCSKYFAFINIEKLDMRYCVVIYRNFDDAEDYALLI